MRTNNNSDRFRGGSKSGRQMSVLRTGKGVENRMSIQEIILKRRSIRKYSGENLSEETIKKILEAGLLAPASQNRKPCEFYVIRNKEILKQLSKAKKMGAGMLADADTAIAVFGDSGKADTWVEDCSIALSYMSLQAEELGVGNCWVQMHLRSTLLGKDAEENVRRILGVENSGMRIVGILSLGIPEKELKGHTLEEADWNKVHEIG